MARVAAFIEAQQRDTMSPMANPIIHSSDEISTDRHKIGSGAGFEIHEWTGSGPGYLHVHHEDDEAWHVI